MSYLSKIKKGDGDLPPRVLLTGPEGIGKSTWASHAPSPLFIASEDGLTGLDFVERITPADLTELNGLLDELFKDIGKYRTLVFDTADWLERFIYTSICKRDGKGNVEDYGYGKGYVVAENELVKILAKLDAIRAKHKIGIVFLAHVQIRTFNDPRGESWDRYEMKGNKKMSGILREWPDACLFAVFEVHKVRKTGEQRDRAIGGERIVHTEWSPAWDAKNRLQLPETLPLEYAAFAEATTGNTTPKLREDVKAAFKAAKLDDAAKKAWEKFITTIESRSADELKIALERLTAKKGN